MSFALLYRSLSHTRWYWSVSQNFTQKSERQFTWESAADLAADYPKLRSHYPTLFANLRRLLRNVPRPFGFMISRMMMQRNYRLLQLTVLMCQLMMPPSRNQK